MIRSQGVPKVLYFKDPIELKLDGKVYKTDHIKTTTLIQVVKLTRKSASDNFVKILALLFNAEQSEFEKIDAKNYLAILASVCAALWNNVDFETSRLIGGLSDS